MPVAGPKGSFEETGTPKGSNVKQGPQRGPTANRDPKGVQHQTGRNRKSEISMVSPRNPGLLYAPSRRPRPQIWWCRGPCQAVEWAVEVEAGGK